jgi:hypothetical protein
LRTVELEADNVPIDLSVAWIQVPIADRL